MALRGLGYDNSGARMPSLEVRIATTFEGRLKEEKKNLEERLTDINKVLEAFKKAPQVTEIIEALNKLGY